MDAIGLTTAAYTQNFDGLGTATATVTGGDLGLINPSLDGWVFAESGSSGNTTITVGTGSSGTGDTYNFGALNALDRALGGLQSGSVIPTFGASFINNNPSAITALDIAYFGEQWRVGTANREDRLDFQYSLDASSLTNVGATWVNFDALDFNAPQTTTGAKNGNDAAHRTSVAASISSLNIAPGATFWIRWTDFNAANADDGLAIDDFSITATAGGDMTPPTVTSITHNEDNLDNTVASGEMVTYTVSFSEDINAATVTETDFFNAGTSAITFGTITETSPGVFTIEVTPTTAGTLRLGIDDQAVIQDVAGNALLFPLGDILDEEEDEITVTAGDISPPTIVSINDDDADDVIGVGATVTYTVTFSEDIDEATVSAADFDNAGTSTFTIGTIIETSPGVFTVPVTATSEGTLRLRIPTSATITDVADPANALVVDPAILDDETIQVDGTAPTLTLIVDNVSGGPSFTNSPITFTVTFSEDIDAATVTAADFDNAGSSAINVGAITETSPGVFTVVVTPTSAGTVQLQIPTTAVISDLGGNNLDVTTALLDDTTITINAVTTLAVGDLSIIGFNSNSPDGFAFVPWVGLSPGTVIKFTDNAFLSAGSANDANNARGGENFVTWTNNTGNTIAAGTVITIIDGSPATTSAGSVAQTLGGISNSGDNIFAYQGAGAGTTTTNSDFGTNSNPTTFTGSIVFGLVFGSGFLTTGTASSNTTYLPSELNVANGNIALSTASTSRGQYTGTRTATSIAELKALVTNPANWTTATGGGVITLDTTAFTVAADTTPPTITTIDDNDPDDTVLVNEMLTYTITFSEDIDESTVTAADFDNAGSSAITIGTITETSAGVFSVQVTPTTAGTLQLRIPIGSVITDVAGNVLDVPVTHDTVITVNATDITPPTVVSITDDDADDIIGVGATVTYTVTFSEDIDETSVSEDDFENAGSSTVTFGTITETSAGVFTIPLTATSVGTVQLRIPSTATILDVAGNALVVDPAILDAETITVDGTAPTLTSIADNISGGPGFVNQPITFTVTFNEDIDAATVTADDFDNAGDSTVTFGAINETSPGVFTVVVTPTTAGTVQLRIPTTAVIADLGGNNLDVTSALLDDTTITVNGVTALAVGDITIIGYRSDNPDGLAFVTWVDLLPGTSINFWDSGYIGGGDGTGQGPDGGTWRTNEDFATWTNDTGSTITPGTVIVLTFPNVADQGSLSGGLGLNNNPGDQIFAGQGQFVGSSPSTFDGTLIFGLDFNDAAGWDEGVVDTASLSRLPSVLAVTHGNLAPSHVDNGQYTGSRVFTSFNDARAAVLNLANWTLENSDTAFGTLSSTDFTLSTPGFVIVQRDGTTRVFENGNPGAAGVDGRTDTFTVVLSSQPTSDVVLTVTSADTGEATVSPATLTFTSANWDTPQTVTVTGVADNVADGDQAVDVTVAVDDALSDDSFDPLADQIVSVTVVDTPNRPTVTSIAGVDTTIPTLNFADVTGETGYTVVVIDISVSPAVEVFRDDTIAADSTTYTFTTAGLQTGRTYRAFLFATNGADNYSPSGGLDGSFTQFTIGGAPVAPPARPVATGTSGAANQPTINWPAASNPPADFYSVYLINLATGALVQSTTGIADNEFTPASTLADGRYRIWVSATNSAGNSGFGAPFDFTVGAPIIAPTAPTGINASNPAAITWTAPAGATTYSVYLINRATNAVVSNTTGLASPSFTPAPALADGSYRIWVSASNAAGTSPFSTPLDFSVGTPLVAPTVPTGLAVTGLNTTTPTVTWNVVPSATSYAVYFINRDTNTVISSVTNLTTPSFTPSSPLALMVNYRIWVRAINLLGSSAFSTPLDFKLDDVPVL